LTAVLVKQLTAHDDPDKIVFLTNMMLMPLSLIPALFVWTWPTAAVLPALIGMGVCAVLGHSRAGARLHRDLDASLALTFEFSKLPFTSRSPTRLRRERSTCGPGSAARDSLLRRLHHPPRSAASARPAVKRRHRPLTLRESAIGPCFLAGNHSAIFDFRDRSRGECDHQQLSGVHSSIARESAGSQPFAHRASARVQLDAVSSPRLRRHASAATGYKATAGERLGRARRSLAPASLLGAHPNFITAPRTRVSSLAQLLGASHSWRNRSGHTGEPGASDFGKFPGDLRPVVDADPGG
jgi:hypothetical protein